MLEATMIKTIKGSREYTSDWRYNKQFNKQNKSGASPEPKRIKEKDVCLRAFGVFGVVQNQGELQRQTTPNIFI